MCPSPVFDPILIKSKTANPVHSAPVPEVVGQAMCGFNRLCVCVCLYLYSLKVIEKKKVRKTNQISLFFFQLYLKELNLILTLYPGGAKARPIGLLTYAIIPSE